MLKIKVLKKKKKGKKSKHKEDDLFKPEELEAYRKEHQQQQQQHQGETSEAGATGENEEWKKFLALTSGVDDILKKTQGDLDRIKSTSFFQRVPPPSEVKKKEEERAAAKKAEETPVRQEVETVSAVHAAIVEVSESESEEEDEDDIFDTAYIDALAGGEVKLAYIPESPDEQPEGDDPFDTSYAEKAILGPNAERKGKKLVPIGAAVEILTGRVQAPTCASIKRPNTSKREILKQKDLLLGSFEANDVILDTQQSNTSYQVKTSLLDDDAPPELSSEPIDLSKSFVQAIVKTETESNQTKDILKEFDCIASSPVEEDDEFALLAAESLSKHTGGAINTLPQEILPQPARESWNAFEDQKNGDQFENEIDPFDTAFAENILPGQAELKLIEQEILKSDNDFDFNPRAEETYTELIRNSVSIQLTNPSGQRESVSSLERIRDKDLSNITPIHRDLLGGSSTDLTQLGDKPLQPNESIDEEILDYSDPFDTSVVDTAALPGQTELKLLERELLSDIKKPLSHSISDEDFDPRANTQTIQSIQNRKVSFDLPLGNDLLAIQDDGSKAGKPLTPYYARENSIPEQNFEDDNVDPFDTSFVANIKPGKTELKLLEDELLNSEIKPSFSDQDFNPREISPVQKSEPIDLLAAENDIQTKILTPAFEQKKFEEPVYIDPFDTSIACNILPGKTELKLLESELINSEIVSIKRNLTDPEFDPRIGLESEPIDLLAHPSDDFKYIKPLTPVGISFETGEPDNFDPFDTSIANNIAPGPSELKLLEAELI